MTFRDNRANSTKQNVKRERYSDMPLFTMIIMHALTAMFSWVSLGNHPILQLSTSCLSRTFSNVISMAESQSIMIHNNGENEDFCVKWGPNEDHFSNLVLMHEDQVINWGPFRNHWIYSCNGSSRGRYHVSSSDSDGSLVSLPFFDDQLTANGHKGVNSLKIKHQTNCFRNI